MQQIIIIHGIEKNQSELTEIYYSAVGNLVEHQGAGFIKADIIDGPGFMLYGPYEYFEKGKYNLEFGIHYDGIKDKTKINNSVCFVDVATNGGNTTIIQKKIHLDKIDKNQKIELSFELIKDSALEFRVYTYGIAPLMVNIHPQIIRI